MTISTVPCTTPERIYNRQDASIYEKAATIIVGATTYTSSSFISYGIDFSQMKDGFIYHQFVLNKVVASDSDLVLPIYQNAYRYIYVHDELVMYFPIDYVVLNISKTRINSSDYLTFTIRETLTTGGAYCETTCIGFVASATPLVKTVVAGSGFTFYASSALNTASALSLVTAVDTVGSLNAAADKYSVYKSATVAECVETMMHRYLDRIIFARNNTTEATKELMKYEAVKTLIPLLAANTTFQARWITSNDLGRQGIITGLLYNIPVI